METDVGLISLGLEQCSYKCQRNSKLQVDNESQAQLLFLKEAKNLNCDYDLRKFLFIDPGLEESKFLDVVRGQKHMLTYHQVRVAYRMDKSQTKFC